MNVLRNTTSRIVDLNDVRDYSIRKTLADEDIRYGGAILVDMVIDRLAHTMDRRPTDFEVSHHDVMSLDAYSWRVVVEWWIGCDLCEYVAADQSLFDADLCPIHFNEALEQNIADNDNDDRAIGMMP